MTDHTFLLDLPDVLESMGFNVEVADGYAEGQGNYLWTNPHTNVRSYAGQPWGYMVHHSASGAATPPPHDTSKANAWIGLWRDGRLYQEGGGTPTIYLASAGPARISSGYGYRPAAWDHTFEQRRAPAKAQGSDGDTALNRYVFNMETVHRGDGSPIDDGVLACVIGLGVALEQMTGLKEMTLGHLSWSKRKIDPYWNNDRTCITQVQAAVADEDVEPPPVDPDPPPTGEYVMQTVRHGDGFIDDSPEKRAAVKALQIMLSHHDYFDNNTQDPRCGADGAFEDGTEAALKDFQGDKGLTVDGICGPASWSELDKVRA